MAELALVGDGPEMYQIWLGGSPNLTRLALKWKDKVKWVDMDSTLEPLLAFWKQQRSHSDEAFGDFCTRIGLQALTEYVQSPFIYIFFSSHVSKRPPYSDPVDVIIVLLRPTVNSYLGNSLTTEILTISSSYIHTSTTFHPQLWQRNRHLCKKKTFFRREHLFKIFKLN